jgi:hypothetical protein
MRCSRIKQPIPPHSTNLNNRQSERKRSFLVIPECNEATRNGDEGRKDGLGPKAAHRSIAKESDTVDRETRIMY